MSNIKMRFCTFIHVLNLQDIDYETDTEEVTETTLVKFYNSLYDVLTVPVIISFLNKDGF